MFWLQVVTLFESEKESDSDEEKSKRFEKLVELMQKVIRDNLGHIVIKSSICTKMRSYS